MLKIRNIVMYVCMLKAHKLFKSTTVTMLSVTNNKRTCIRINVLLNKSPNLKKIIHKTNDKRWYLLHVWHCYRHTSII